jgi:Zn-dependent protease
MIVAAAGPLSNFAQAIVCALIVRAVFGVTDVSLIPAILRYAVEINLLLAFFNLIPIPPLDGGNVLAGLVPERGAAVLDGLRNFGFILIYALMLTGVLADLILPPTDFLVRLLLL